MNILLENNSILFYSYIHTFCDILLCVCVCLPELFYHNRKKKNLSANIMKCFFKNLYFIHIKNYESTNLKTIFGDFVMSLGNAHKMI